MSGSDGRLLARGGALAAAALAGVVAQRQHAILRNFPVVGHLRYLLESVGPELRQYIVTSNDEERPFSRDQRRWVYASAKREINTFGFGSDNEMSRSTASSSSSTRRSRRPLRPTGRRGRRRTTA
jgi:glutamate synthase domain-containing protein 2